MSTGSSTSASTRPIGKGDDGPCSIACSITSRLACPVTASVSARAVTIAARVSVTRATRSEEHTSELQSLMRISYAVFCLKKKKKHTDKHIYFYNTNKKRTQF